MKASDWMYVGEGGKHVIFSYVGSGDDDGGGNDDDKWKRRVLRIAKDVLCAAAPPPLGNSTTTTNDNKNRRVTVGTTTDESIHYVQSVVKPLLGQYVDVPQVICLPWEFVANLRDRTLSEGTVPPSRQFQWERRKPAHNQGLSPLPLAQVTWNYQKNMNDSSCCISIEIKPKAGYTAFSPLVDSIHRVKFRKTRFEILQQLHCNGYITKGWHRRCTKLQPSLYNPLDLYSGEPRRVKRALDHLVMTPQNNLRIWIDGHPLQIGTDKADTNDVLHIMIMSHDHCHEDGVRDRASFFDWLTTTITPILIREELLQKLLKLQRLDVLDADGAILVYDHLRELCGDSADEFIDSATSILSIRGAKDEESILGDSPFAQPIDCPALDSLLDEIGSFSSNLNDSSLTSSNDMNTSLERSRMLVSSLSREACVFLLRNWLLSLVMCDVSFFVVLTPFSCCHDLTKRRVETDDVDKNKSDSSYSVCCCQTERSPGVLVADDKAFTYSLKVVDCDKKPANKLEKRKGKEETIRFYKEGQAP